MSRVTMDDTWYTDDTALNPDEHNKNLYDETAPTRGVMSEMNGYISATNLDTDFSMDRSHLWPGQCTRAVGELMLAPIEMFNDAFANKTSDPDQDDDYSPIPGASLRFHQPYDAALAVLHVDAFVSAFKPIRIKTNNERGFYSMYTKLFFDGVGIDHTVRALPQSALIYMDGWAMGGGTLNFEASHGFEWSFHYMVDGLAAGYHDVHLGVFIETPTTEVEMGLRYGVKSKKTKYYFGQRLFCGIRSARVLTIL